MLSVKLFKNVFLKCIWVFFLLVILHKLSIWVIDYPIIKNLFDFNLEKNVPTLFSCFLMGMIAVKSFAISKYYKLKSLVFAQYWKALSIIFLILLWDEWMSIHDTLGGAIAKLFVKDAAHSWIYTYIVIVVLGLLAFIPFFKRIQGRLKWHIVLAASVYLVGAMGFEYINVFFQQESHLNWVFFLEESFEMSGLLLFSWSLLDHINEYTNIEKLTLFKKTAAITTAIFCIDMIVSQYVFLWH